MGEVKVEWSFRLPEGISVPISSSDGKALPSQSQLSIPVRSQSMGHVADAIDMARDQINAVTTAWRDAVGKQEEKILQEKTGVTPAQVKNTVDEEGAEGEEDEEDEDEEGL